MTKALLTFLIATLIVPFVNGQTATDTLFIITFRPSFHNPSQLTVYKDQDQSKGLFQAVSVVNGKMKIDTMIATFSDETYNSYLTFFLTYKFPGFIDNKFPDTTQNYVQGLDGITITGAYYSDTKKLFRFWSPYHDKESMALFKMTLNDLDKYFKTSDNKKYLKGLKMYSK
jgi:hypothetical protein